MYSEVGGYGGIAPRENLNFENLRNAFFQPSGTVVCIITDAVTTKLKGHFFGDPPLYTPYFFGYPPP